MWVGRLIKVGSKWFSGSIVVCRESGIITCIEVRTRDSDHHFNFDELSKEDQDRLTELVK